MGYILASILAAVALIGLFLLFTRGRNRPVGRTQPRHDMTYKQPVGEEITPTPSTTATVEQAEAARRRTPPA